MKKNFEKPSVVVMDLHCDVICTSGYDGNLKPGWGPNKGDNGTIDGHTVPGGNGNGHGNGNGKHSNPGSLVW